MSNIPGELRYATSHEWIKADSGTGTVGITDHAQQELSDIVYVDLPKVGAQAKAGAVIAVVESVKAASDINSPVSGEVIEINADLAKKPELVNQDPYGGGWLFRVKLANPSELDALKDAAAYQAQIGG
jgi:glycine cleavage system H protein